ncbi:DUF3263 domain-containing protein [Rhodococcus sp. NPDC057529]|uniref:DUF3263 domain-containing protein n=1 Tax=Rhodococcus sp. NPDC057529 TaxID=3346158 RepID=UPI00366F5CD0
MDSYHEDMLKFAAEWAPYGGGEEHVLPTFGLTAGDYYRRLMRLLETLDARSLPVPLILRLRHQCLERLAATGTEDARHGLVNAGIRASRR